MSDALLDLGRIWYSPNAAILRIMGNPRQYVALSVVVFALSSVFAMNAAQKAIPFVTAVVVTAHVFSGGIVNVGDSQGGDFGVEDILTWSENRLATTSVVGIISNIVWIAVAYFVSGKLGTKSSFEKIFCTMSYALMPILVGSSIMAGSLLTFLFLLEHESFTAGGIAMVQTVVFAHILMYLSFIIWSLIITVKAIKRTNDIGTVRSVGIIVVASITSDIVTILLSSLHYTLYTL